MIRVLVADDSPTARALLVGILSSDPLLEVVGEARDGVEAVELTQALQPDVVTMDIHMPRLNGFEAAALNWSHWTENCPSSCQKEASC